MDVSCKLIVLVFSREIGWDKHLQNDAVFCVEWDIVEPLLSQLVLVNDPHTVVYILWILSADVGRVA